ncbi:MAG: hypothetical protein ACYDHW_07010 [Syntrophorhabdaceae bacterium]
MIQFKAKEPIEIGKGKIIEITKDQAMPRLHNLKLLKGSKYEVKNPVCFKAGEIVGLDPSTSTKAFLGSFERVSAGK